MEIERQFLVDIIPSLPSGYDSILQGYVSLLPEIRIRAVRPMQGEEKFYLTVKRGAGLVREEWETAISSREFSTSRRMPGEEHLLHRETPLLLAACGWSRCRVQPAQRPSQGL